MYNGVTIKDIETNNYFGGGVTITDGSTFHMYGGTIDNCGIQGGSVCYGGGVAAINGGSFIMDGGTIKNCYAYSDYTDTTDPNRCFTAVGGGVFVSNGSYFQMNGGTVTNCKATNFGGGIALDISYGELYNKGYGYLQSRVEINGGTIDGNTASAAGGGVFASGYFYSNADAIAAYPSSYTIPDLEPGLVINGGTISNNTADGDSGGGVFVAMLRPAIKAEIKNAVITGNTALTGAGIQNFGYWTTLFVDGCDINGNTAEENGGGVMASTNSSGGNTTIRNCNITDNISGSQGAGVYYDANSEIRISGANTIQDNKWNGTVNNLNVLSSGKPVKVVGDLAGSKIGVTDYTLRDDGLSDEDENAVSADSLTSGYKTYNSVNPNNLFTSDHNTWTADFSETPNANEVRLVRKTRTPNNSVSLTTKDSVDINFYIDVPYYIPAETDRQEAYVTLNYNHNSTSYDTDFKTRKVELKDVTAGDDGRFKFTIESAPAQLTEKIKITLYNKNSDKLYDADYSMWQYCDDIIQNAMSIEETSADPEVIEKWQEAAEVCKALTDYATAAQMYFNYNTSDLAHKSVSDRADKYYNDEYNTSIKYFHDVSNVTKEDVKSGGATAKIEGDLPFAIEHTSLMSLSNTEARFYFDEKEVNPADYTVSVSVGNDWYGSSKPTAKFGTANSGSFITVGGIESTNLDSTFTLTVSGGGKTGSIKYNALAYCYTVLRDTESGTFDEPEKVNQLRSMVKAVYLYNHYANAYFEG